MDDIIILYCDISDLSVNKLDAYVDEIPGILMERIRSYKNMPGRYLRIAGYYLLMKGMSNLNIDRKCISNVSIGAYGKLYVSDNSFFFNISHSENLVTCIISKYFEVGIDVEYQKDINYEELKIYSDNEKEVLFDSPHNFLLFYDIWTRKEAVLKCLGYGLNLDLKSIDVTRRKIILFNSDYSIHSFTMLKKYSCSFVTLSRYDAFRVIRIKSI